MSDEKHQRGGNSTPVLAIYSPPFSALNNLLWTV